MRLTLESAETTIGWPVDFMTDLHGKLTAYAKSDYNADQVFALQNRLQELVKQYQSWKLLENPTVDRVARRGAEADNGEAAFVFDDEQSWLRLRDVNRREFFIKVTP